MRARVLLAAAFLVAVGAGGVHAREPDVHRRGVRVVRAPSGEALRGDNWLLLVAIGRYGEWRNLRGPRKDVAALKEALLDRYAFDAAHTVELYDEKATKAGIIGVFRDLGRRLGPEDSLLVYYAGHGHTDEFSRTGYWIPYDAGADTAVQERWLPNAAVRGYLREMKCSHVLLVSDSCFSGDLLDEQRGREPEITDAYFRRAYRMQARQVLTSGASEPVSDTGLGGRSAFAFHLVRTLERNRKPYLDPLQLYVHVRAGVKGQMPLLGSLKGAGHQDGGAYIFFLREGGPSEPAPPSGGLDLSDLARQSETRKQWDGWLARMKTDYREVERFVAGTTDASLNVKAWQRFVDTYRQDDPFSTEDESLRSGAERELARWRRKGDVDLDEFDKKGKRKKQKPKPRPKYTLPVTVQRVDAKGRFVVVYLVFLSKGSTVQVASVTGNVFDAKGNTIASTMGAYLAGDFKPNWDDIYESKGKWITPESGIKAEADKPLFLAAVGHSPKAKQAKSAKMTVTTPDGHFRGRGP